MDNAYHLYYGDPGAVNPPDELANAFVMGDDFDDGTLTGDLSTSINGVATISETGGEAVLSGGSANGTQLTQTNPVAWASVENAGDPFWFYWGDVYTGAYWHDARSDWVHLRDYVDPKPTTAFGPEEILP